MQTKDFKGQDLRGKSFKNQDLTGADFSDCDLRGVDFSFANLTDAKFCNARMGSTLKVNFGLQLFRFLLSVTFGFIAALGNVFLWAYFKSTLQSIGISSDVHQIVFVIVYSALFATVLLTASIRDCWNYILYFCGLIIIVYFLTILFTSLREHEPLVIFFGGISVIVNLAAILTGGIAGGITMIGTGVIVGGAFIDTNAALAVNFKRKGLVEVLFRSRRKAGSSAIFGAEAGAVIGAIIASVAIKTSIDGIIVGIVAGLIYVIAGIYLGWRASKKEESQLSIIRNWSLEIACWCGTEFAFANLNQVDFNSADLKYSHFKNAKLINCNFKNAKNHHLALTDGTPLEPRKVRNLVIDGIITDKNFAALDLRGLDFSNLNLQDFDFSHADLSSANLSHTQLTGATLEGWNIDTETRLDDIDCRYYYYLENGAKKRMPPEGEQYYSGEFTRIFQKIANTIDFIAHNEIELAAIKLSVEQVRVESGNDDIRVQAIEEKDGFIVVKVTVPKAEDRGVLYHEVNSLKQEYETKIQGLMAEKHIQIGKIEVLKEQLKEQRDDFLAAIKDGRTIHTSTYIEGDMKGGNVAGNDVVINTKN